MIEKNGCASNDDTCMHMHQIKHALHHASERDDYAPYSE